MIRLRSGLVSWYEEPSGERPRRLCVCFRRSQKKTPNPMVKPSPSATPNTMPTTWLVLTPPLLLAPPPSVGSAPAVGVTRIVFTIPVTVVTIVNGVMDVVRAFAGVVEGDGVWGVAEGVVEVVDTTKVLDCVTKALATGTSRS